MTPVPPPFADDETAEQASVGDHAIGKTRLLSRQCPTLHLRLGHPMHTTRIWLHVAGGPPPG